MIAEKCLAWQGTLKCLLMETIETYKPDTGGLEKVEKKSEMKMSYRHFLYAWWLFLNYILKRLKHFHATQIFLLKFTNVELRGRMRGKYAQKGCRYVEQTTLDLTFAHFQEGILFGIVYVTGCHLYFLVLSGPILRHFSENTTYEY